ncbi:MAG: YggS family pyridoxal phosphate-dependent enzyme [Thermodesulfovibrionales bacterium]
MTDDFLADNIKEIHRRIVSAAMRAGREPDAVRLIAVSKNVDAGTVVRAIENGVRDLGESRIQEASEKIPLCAARTTGSLLVWHLIGHLQKNKARAAVGLFDLIHSVDSAGLAEEIERHAARAGKIQRVLVQVRISEEETKHGIAGDGLLGLLDVLRGMEHIAVEGLMGIPRFFENPEDSRPWFRLLRELRDAAVDKGFRLPELSMGMSHDFEVAVEEGATMVRVGTAIFGERRV